MIFRIIFLLVATLLLVLLTIRNKIKYKNEEDDDEEVEENFNEYKELEDLEIVHKFKIKNGYYRNFPNQKTLKKINRKKPNYLRNYHFKYAEFGKEKLEVENSKYILMAQREQQFFDKKELPSSYLVDEIVLMPKNTDTLYTYWEIREDTFERISNEFKLVSENPIIILKNMDNVEQFRIDTYQRNGSMYINNVVSNKEYIAYIGFIDENNNFIEISHSQNVLVPNPEISKNFDINWGVSEIKYNEEGRIIDFKKLDKYNIDFYLGFKQEVLDSNPVDEEMISYKLSLGSSELSSKGRISSSDMNK